jgi:putative oxidoreductase
MNDLLHRVAHSRVTGRAARVTAGLRIFVGVVFVFFGGLKFLITQFEVAEFVRFGFPESALVVQLVGLLEVAAGLMLVVGLATRLAALGLAVVMAGAILTAGLSVGGPFHLGLAPALLAANLYLLVAGPGSLALDRRLAAVG